MKHCPRCQLSKLDANFIKRNDRGFSKVLVECQCCQMHRNQGRTKIRKIENVKTLTTQASRIKISKEDAKLVTLARREMKNFRKRGAPEVKRPYAYVAGNPEKGLVSRGWIRYSQKF